MFLSLMEAKISNLIFKSNKKKSYVFAKINWISMSLLKVKNCY